jgi:hypothetical protein
MMVLSTPVQEAPGPLTPLWAVVPLWGTWMTFRTFDATANALTGSLVFGPWMG